MKYDKVFMYDKLNGNLLYIRQIQEHDVLVNFVDMPNSKILVLHTTELEHELFLEHLVIGEPKTLSLLYGKTTDKSKQLLHSKE